MFHRLPAALRALWVALPVCLGAAHAEPQPPVAAVTVVGAPETVFSVPRDACDANDQPDAPVRVFRDEAGELVMFGLHTKNRALRGRTFDALKIDCRPTLPSGGDADPAAYDDASWVTATWTEDGRRVAALLHHEYHAADHPGRCARRDYLACWYSTVVAVASPDGGRSFARTAPPVVVAAAPFRQEVDQTRQRGFFNPSNIVARGNERFVLIHTTGWAGQPNGVCLFRARAGDLAGGWRAYDGRGFTARLGDPYRDAPGRTGAGRAACRTVGPFTAAVGSVSRHRESGVWLAVFQASAEGEALPQAGFYTTTSRDLLTWDRPRLLLAGPTLYDDACRSGGRMLAYPSLVDREARGRNFDDIGSGPDLYYTVLAVDGCTIKPERDLVRRRVDIRILP